MPVGTKTDFKMYNEQFHSGYMERLAQVTDGFNAASNNAIMLDVGNGLGEFEIEAFFARLAAPTSRRDTTSVAAQTPKKMSEVEKAAVKLARKFDEIRGTVDSLRKIGVTAEDMSFRLGQLYAEHKVEMMLNDGIRSLVAAISGQANAFLDVSANGGSNTATYGNLNRVLRKFGDRSKDVVCWVMPGTALHDLMGGAIAANIYDVSSIVIKEGSTPTLGRPTFVTDCESLVAGTDDVILGLTAGAVVIKDLGTSEILWEKVGGNENIEYRFQAEWDHSVELKGFTWDMTNGGVNPTNAALGTSSNWDMVVNSIKNTAGVALQVAQAE